MRCQCKALNASRASPLADLVPALAASMMDGPSARWAGLPQMASLRSLLLYQPDPRLCW